MMSSPVTMRSTLRARGVHAASVSFMVVPPVEVARKSYRVAPPRESCSPPRIAGAFAKQHGITVAAKCLPRHSVLARVLFFPRFDMRNGRAETTHRLGLAGKPNIGADRR